MTTRDEHLAWCKQRALEYVEAGDVHLALASMTADMGNHPGTADPDIELLGMSLMVAGHLNTPAEMRRWIEGFN